jgi:hypothetical protein
MVKRAMVTRFGALRCVPIKITDQLGLVYGYVPAFLLSVFLARFVSLPLSYRSVCLSLLIPSSRWPDEVELYVVENPQVAVLVMANLHVTLVDVFNAQRWYVFSLSPSSGKELTVFSSLCTVLLSMTVLVEER